MGVPSKKNSRGKTRTNNILNPHLTPGHIGGKRAYSPLRQPCSPIHNIAYKRDCEGLALVNEIFAMFLGTLAVVRAPTVIQPTLKYDCLRIP